MGTLDKRADAGWHLLCSAAAQFKWITAGSKPQLVQRQYRLTLQADGNLVVTGPGGVTKWASGTGGSGATRLNQQIDSNLVLYRDDRSPV